MEMENLGDRMNEENEEEETNLDDNDDNNPIDNDNPIDDDKNAPTPARFDPNIPNVGRDAGVMRRSFARNKKNFLKKINKGDGSNSKILFDNLQLTFDQRTGKNNGAKFKGAKNIVFKNGEYEYSSNVKARSTINDFKQLYFSGHNGI